MYYNAKFDASIYTTSKGLSRYILSSEAISDGFKYALDEMPTPVLITDRNYIVIFANMASLLLLDRVQKQMNFFMQGIIGVNIAFFYENTAQVTDSFILNITPLRNARGEFSGAFVDWDFITESVRTENFLENALCLTA